MKKFLAIIVFVIVGIIPTFAQVFTFKTTGFCYKENIQRNYSKWQESSMLITIDFNNDIVTIFSPVTQRYNIVENIGDGWDLDGEYVIRLRFIDQDGDYGIMRLIQRKNKRSEIYIDFNNISWCYSVIRT